MKIKKFIKVILIVIIAMMFFSRDNVNANNEIDWNDWQDENYWEWYTRTTTDDKAYNGKHIEIKDDAITFYGYGQTSYKDFLYKEYNKEGKKTFQFIIDESKANYHTLDGAGFIFNANKVEDKLSGYILLFREKDVCIYRVEDVDVNTFATATKSTIETYGELLKSKIKEDSDIHNLVIEVTPTNVRVTENDNEMINLELEYSKHSGNSFGLIASYVEHNCSRLSKIEFSELKIKIEDYKITILNTNMQGNPITEGYFEVKDEKGNIVQEGNTDENGKIILDGIKSGIYTIQQKIAPKTYILNENIYKVKVSEENKEIEVIVKNEQNKIVEEIENTTDNDIVEERIVEDIETDNTRSNTAIPYAGEKTSLIVVLLAFSIILGIGSLVKIKKYNQY